LLIQGKNRLLKIAALRRKENGACSENRFVVVAKVGIAAAVHPAFVPPDRSGIC
jgi:hypothetical protein